MNPISPDSLKRSRLLYTVEAALEHLISILVTGSFLATLTNELGFSDSLTGIMSSVISLGCLFQLLSLLVRGRRQKRFVIVLSILNQLLFTLLYAVPLVRLDGWIKAGIFIVMIFSAYLLYNLAHPKKISWLMSLVDDSHRGRFTANKEIISLLSGMVFSFCIGSVIDYFAARGRIKIAFVLSGLMIFILMLLHSLTMIFAVEKTSPIPPKKSFKSILLEPVKNKSLLRVAVVFILYYISTYSSVPFYGTYQINELGLNLKFISSIVICGSISRISVSRFWGRYADKRSFAAMIEKCFVFLGISQICVILAVPSNGAVMFVLYNIFYGIASGGINSALTNLIIDHVMPEKRADSLAITQACAGLTGFLTTLCISPIVSYIQNNGNHIFGLQIYAQQFVSSIAFVFTVLAIFYTRHAFLKKEG